MKIIDSHIHTAFEDVMIKKGAEISKVDYSIQGFIRESEQNNITNAVSMGIKSDNCLNCDKFAETPIISEGVSRKVINIAGINPYKSSEKNLTETEKYLKNGTVHGLKIYLGYYPFYPSDKIYLPYYELASKYKVPVIFHTGDTYSENALVKYSHPLGVDEIAVNFRNVNFVLAHFGNPWVFETAELIWKNKNVYADLSGLVVGDMNQISGVSEIMVKEALKWPEKFDKILYGSDWPLVPMGKYIKFIKNMVPKKEWEKVFYLNAKKLFNL